MSDPKTNITRTRFAIGDVVNHRLYNYRGVVVDVDPCFQLSDEWYETVARSRPPKNEPWYHVLVHEATNSTYVAEKNLELDVSGEVVDHPMVERFFTAMVDGRYINDDVVN